MGGRIAVSSQPGVGSTFVVTLRRAQPAAVRPAIRSELRPDPPRVYARERCLLYVEDTLTNIRLVEEILRQRPSIRVIPAMQGRLGLELARDHRPDLILLDLHPPTCRARRCSRNCALRTTTREIPVVVLSADSTRRRQPLVAAGARAYLTKPISVRRLLEVLDEQLADDER